MVAERGGAVAAVPYMKTQMVESHRERMRRIETGELAVVGKNVFTEAEPSPLQEGEDGGILRVDPAVEAGAIARSTSGAQVATRRAVDAALVALRSAASSDENIMPLDAGCGAGRSNHG